MRLNAYLTFGGQCEAALRFYEKCLRGKIVMMMTYGESPMADSAPPGWSQKILHATLAVGDQVLQGADQPAERYVTPQGFSIAVNISDPAEAERIFNDLAEKGSVQFPLQGTFWARRFGVLTDRFGTPWIINCENPD